MINIYILHCDNYEMKNIVDVVRKHHIYENIKLYISINFEYELDYFARHRSMDIVILQADFVYNGYDGIFLSKRIKIINRETLIIFLSKSTNKEQLIKIINAEPFAYIKSKDILVSLTAVLDNAIAIKSKDVAVFTYQKRGENVRIPLKRVIYFSSSHRIIRYVCIDGEEDYFYDKMNNIEAVITKISNDFIRINQSYLINTKFVISISKNEVIMINNHIITISRKYYKNKYAIFYKLN